MNEKKLENLLKQADSSTPLRPIDSERLSLAIRGRLRRQKQAFRYGMMAAAAMITVVCVFSHQRYLVWQKEREIARLEKDVRDLSCQTEFSLALVQKVLDRQRQQDKMREINRQAARSRYAIRAEVDEAAFLLVYQADQMVEKYNQKEKAIEYYQQVIKFFGETTLAQTARQRLMQMEQENQSNPI